MKEILHRAEQLENKYDWLEAAESFDKALNLLSEEEISKKGEIQERLAFDFYRFAFQAESNDEFRQRLRQAVHSYEKAKELYQKVNELTMKARTLRCDAVIAYVSYWLVSEASEKKRLVDECWALTKASLKALSESQLAKEYGKTYNLLSTSALSLFCLEWDYETRKKIIKEAVEHGEVAIEFLARTDDMSELARAYSKTSFCLSLWGNYFVELDEKDNCVRKTRDYWSKAKATCEDSAWPEMVYPISGPHDFLWGTGNEEALTSTNRALEHGKKARDKFIVGSAFDWLTYHTSWTIGSTDDPAEFAQIKRKVVEYAEEAKRQYSSISFISPRADFCWIEAIHADGGLLWRGVELETDQQKKRCLAEEALGASKDALKLTEDSGYQWAICMFHWNLSVSLSLLARFETRSEKKKKLLEEALQHRMESLRLMEELEPLGYWDRGLQSWAAAYIKHDLLWLSEDSQTRRRMLEEAVAELENGVRLMARDLEYQPQKRLALFGELGFCQYNLGVWLNCLYELTHNKEQLKKAVKFFSEAVESYRKRALSLASRVAECFWKAAQDYDVLGEHLKGAESFSSASSNFRKAMENVPQLEKLYEQHALYMQAWAEIEKAKYHHERQEYGQAREHFEKAANVHNSLKQWGYLAPNYAAWAELEQAEDLSREERAEEAIKAFEGAIGEFTETKGSLQAQLGKIEDPGEKQMATNMIQATDIRLEYCLARTVVEKARLHDKQGDHYSSSEKYRSAAETFDRISQALENEQECKEMKFIAALSRAWQRMTLAEAEASPPLYVEASRLFEEAKEFSSNEKTKMLLLGHSRFCKALEAGTRFADTRDTTAHGAATKYLESAANFYVRAGQQKASDYAKATELMFDAYVHMDNAKEEKDPEKKAKLYAIAEKVLQTSAGSFMKAEHPEKRKQALTLLENVREERDLAISIAELLHAPSIVSATASFNTPAPTHEQAVGSERFEHAEVNANLVPSRMKLKVGESLDLEIELANAGNGQALLTQIEGAVPEGFEITKKPEWYRLEGRNVNMKGRRLDPLKAEEIRLTLKSKRKGSFTMRPRILYVDETGNAKSHQPEPVTITVGELGIKGWIRGEE